MSSSETDPEKRHKYVCDIDILSVCLVFQNVLIKLPDGREIRGITIAQENQNSQ